MHAFISLNHVQSKAFGKIDKKKIETQAIETKIRLRETMEGKNERERVRKTMERKKERKIVV